jgi:hypothetical protein
MKKKFTLIIYLLCVSASFSFAQTVSLTTVTASPGENISMPLTVGSFTNVAAITFNISYDPTVLTFNSISGGAVTGILAGAAGTTISIVWSATPPTYLTLTGLFCNLNFTYNGGTSSLNFLPYPQCQVTAIIGGIPTTIYPAYTNGGVSPFTGNSHKATLIGQTATTGSVVSVPIKYEGFASGNAAAITQKVHYDVASLNFVGINTLGTLSGAIASASGGVVTITWTNTSGAIIDYPTNVIELKFTYTGVAATTLEFYPGCLITSNTATNIPVSYFNGTITPGTAQGTAVLGNVTGAVQGLQYDVPLNFNFPFGISSFTANITFDSPKLAFIGANTLAKPAGTIVSQVGSTITIVFTDVTAPSINGLFLNLKFQYNGVGIGHVNFAPGCVFTDASLANVQVGYTNATITPGLSTANATIGMGIGTTGSTVLVPIDFSGLPTNMGAATMYIGYDGSMLTYTGVTGNTFGAIVGQTTNQITIAWSAGTGTNINGTFLQLQFIINGAGGTNIVFKDGSILSDITSATVPVNWNNGGVNLLFKVSGTLTYYKAPSANIPLAGFKVYIKNGAQPVPPAVGPIPTKKDSTTTDVNGYFEIWVPNGSYYLYAATTTPWGILAINTSDIINLKRYIALLSNTILFPVTAPPPWTLRQLAADINQDGFINTGDVIPLQRRIALLTPNPNYKAPDWVFENPAVIVNNAHMPNRNFMGSCSGDVNGTYPNP